MYFKLKRLLIVKFIDLVFVTGVWFALAILESLQTSARHKSSIISLKTLVSIGWAIFFQVNVVFDQGSAQFTNKRQRFWIYCFSSCVLLVGVVLNNAYKGDNIVQIISPLPTRVYKTLKDAIENDFKLYISLFPHYLQIHYGDHAGDFSTKANFTLVDYLKVNFFNRNHCNFKL